MTVLPRALSTLLLAAALMLGDSFDAISNAPNLAYGDSVAAEEVSRQPAAESRSSGELIVVKRLEDGTYVPTPIAMVLVVLGLIFFFRRKRRK
jgi:LPXTG-motif cell wall-anchored protein